MWMYQKSWALKTKGIISVVSLGFFAFVGLNNSKTQKPAQAPTKIAIAPTPSTQATSPQKPVVTTRPINKPVTQVASAKPSPSVAPKEISNEDKMKKVIQDYFGKRLRDIDINKASKKKGGGLEIYAQFNQSGWANWSMSKGSAKKSIEDDMREAYFKIFGSGLPVYKFTLANYSTVMDQYGKESEDITYETSLDGDQAQKINWQNRAILDWGNLWQTSFLNRSFRGIS